MSYRSQPERTIDKTNAELEFISLAHNHQESILRVSSRPNKTQTSHSDIDTFDIYVQTFLNNTQKKGNLIFVHGYGDYGARHAAQFIPFYKEGYSITFYDQPGHGRSSGLHGYIPHFSLLTDTLSAVISHIYQEPYADDGKRKHKDNDNDKHQSANDIFLIGESMGGLTVCAYMMQNPKECRLRGVSLYCPFLKNHDESTPHPLVKWIGTQIAYFWPFLPFAPAQRGKVHSDDKVEREFMDDRFTYSGWLRIGTGLSLLTGLEFVNDSTDIEDQHQERIGMIEVPVYIIHGTADRVADVEGSRMFYEKLLSARRRDIWLIDGAQHVLRVDYGLEMTQRTIQFFDSCLSDMC